MIRAKRGLACERWLRVGPVALLVLFGIVHRGTFLLYHWDDLRRLTALAPSTPIWQYLSIPGLTEHLWLSLLYLQQTPPIPNLLLGIGAKWAGWPFGCAVTLMGAQAVVSVLTAVGLYRLLGRLNRRSYVNGAVVLVFLFSTDLLVMEYHSFGQIIYENLAMLLVTWAAVGYFRLRESDRASDAAQIGMALALLGLTRSLYAYFFFVVMGFLLSNSGIRRVRHTVIVLLFVGVAQGGWAVKNFCVYGTARLSPSSWIGLNFAMGLGRSGQREAFVNSILDDAARYPDWFVKMVREKGLVHWHPPDFELYVPSEIRDREREIQRILYGTNQSENSLGQRLISDWYWRAYIRFAVRYPERICRKFVQSYTLFWQPIRNYAGLFIGPLRVEPSVTNSFRLSEVWSAYFGTAGEDQYWEEGYQLRRPIFFFTIPYLPMLMLIVNVWVMHGLLPILLCGHVVARCVRRPGVVPHEWWFLLSCYAYVALTANLAEHGENMRFRLGVEPLIWALSVATIARLPSILGGRLEKAGVLHLRPADTSVVGQSRKASARSSGATRSAM